MVDDNGVISASPRQFGGAMAGTMVAVIVPTLMMGGIGWAEACVIGAHAALALTAMMVFGVLGSIWLTWPTTKPIVWPFTSWVMTIIKPGDFYNHVENHSAVGKAVDLFLNHFIRDFVVKWYQDMGSDQE
eukprot:gene14473-19321_t